jgi:hypothetical protein
MQMVAARVAHAFRRRLVLRLRIFPENPNVFRDASRNHPFVPGVAGLVRDSQSFCESRFSFRKLNPFVGIELDWAMAGQMA